ncbi:sigma-70 family RNA polymerase sigma factor [Clostridioides difficile]
MEEFLENSIEGRDINILIKEYMPLIVKTISSITGRYVSVENDDEFSIALIAFKEAVDKYREDRGSFSSFVKLVISSRIKNYLVKENKFNNVDSIEELKDNGIDISDVYHTPMESSDDLSIEILNLKEEINKFGFSFEDLVEEAPKHEDTRKRAIDISENVNNDVLLKSFMYEKKRLPIKQISTKFSVTEKIIKRSKKFIISVVIILDKNFRNLKLWIRR